MSPFKYAIFLIITLIFLTVIKTFNIALPIKITTTSPSSELSVVGEGKVEVKPDTAFVDAGITVSNARTVEEAQSTVNTVNNKIIEVMKKIGVQTADIKTTNYSVSPNYSYDLNLQNKITGYNTNATVSIKVRNLDLVSQVIDEATKAGANHIGGARFAVEDPNKFREQARDMAIQNAKAQAQKLSRSLGISLGNVVNIVEQSDTGNRPMMAYDTMSVKAAGNAPQIESGTQTVISVVTLYFEKK